MLKNEYLKQWTRIVSEKMPHLSIPQVVRLATWSFGMVMTKSSSLTKVSQFIALVNAEKVTAVRQRLRECYEEAEAKKGLHRRSLDVSSCFAPLLMWVLNLLPVNIKQIALALDATTIGDKFVVLSLNILLAGCGIPIAWCVVLANQPGSWKGHWQKLINAHPAYGRKGIGRELVECVCVWAKKQNYHRILLSTFLDIEWNAPFYTKLGFQILPEVELSFGFQQIRYKEAEAGLPIARRVIMYRNLRQAMSLTSPSGSGVRNRREPPRLRLPHR